MGDSAEGNNVLRDRFPEKRQEQINKRTNVEKVVLYLKGKLGNAKISPAMEEYIARLKATSDLIGKHGGIKSVMPILMDRYDISPSSARRLYQEAQDVYGDITHFNRPFHIDTYMSMLLKSVEGAKNAGDWRSVNGMLKEYKDAIKEFMGTNEGDLYRKIVIPDFRIGFFPEELKVKLDRDWKSKLEKLREAKRRDEIEDAIVVDESDEEDPL